MALIKNASPKNSTGSYSRVLGNEQLGELPGGVAEQFIEWAKGENLSFWV